MLLLSVWSWDRLPVGRPVLAKDALPWQDHDDSDRLPTWAYVWDGPIREFGTSQKMYVHYTNELDVLKAEYVSTTTILLVCKFDACFANYNVVMLHR